MNLRWRKDINGKLILQTKTSTSSIIWEDVPIFEPKETTDIEQAVAAERERCAKIAENYFKGAYASASKEIAYAIRA